MPVDLPVVAPVVSCDGCGACCRHMVRPPFIFLDDPEWDRLVAERPELVAEIEADRAAWPSVDDQRPCLWLDPATRRCRHYEFRPEVCREFEPGGEGCLAHRAAVGP